MIYTVVSTNDNGYDFLIPSIEMVTLDKEKAINYANELMDDKRVQLDYVDVEEWTETESKYILELTRLRR